MSASWSKAAARLLEGTTNRNDWNKNDRNRKSACLLGQTVISVPVPQMSVLLLLTMTPTFSGQEGLENLTPAMT
jgi:hypothetical protein